MSKRITVLIAPIMLFLAPLTHAAVVKSCDKDGFSCKQSAFDFGLTALYLQAYSDLLPSNSLGNSSGTNTFVSSSNNSSGKGPWDWGGIIDGRYYFSDKSDVNLNWMYYSVGYRGTDRSYNTFNSDDGVDNNNAINTVSGKIKLNSVNAEFAQSFELSPRGMVRLFAGGQYLNIKNKSRNVFFSVDDSVFELSTSTSNTYTENKYEGVGPRAGFDAKYTLKGNLSVFASSAAAILLARSTQNLSEDTSFLTSTSTSVSNNLSSSRGNKSIPELEAKLGLTYNQPLAQTMVTLSTGWSVINYFNVLEGNDLTLSGPYVQGKWVG